MNTERSFWSQVCVQTEALSKNLKTNSAALARLLKKKSAFRVTNTQKKLQKSTKISKIEIKLQSPNVVPTQYEYSTAADTEVVLFITSADTHSQYHF